MSLRDTSVVQGFSFTEQRQILLVHEGGQLAEGLQRRGSALRGGARSRYYFFGADGTVTVSTFVPRTTVIWCSAGARGSPVKPE